MFLHYRVWNSPALNNHRLAPLIRKEQWRLRYKNQTQIQTPIMSAVIMHPNWTRNWWFLKSNLSCGCCILGTTFEKLRLSKYGPFKPKQSSTRPTFWTASLHLHPFKRNVSQPSAAAFHLMAFPSPSPPSAPPPPHCHPSPLHLFPASSSPLFSSRQPWQASLHSDFQSRPVLCQMLRGNIKRSAGQSLPGIPAWWADNWRQASADLADVRWVFTGALFLSFFPLFLSFPSFLFESFMCVCARERGEKHKAALCCPPPPPSPLKPAAGAVSLAQWPSAGWVWQ